MHVHPVLSACLLACTTALAQGERNPPGDIPDSQVFVAYRAPAGFRLEVPEGWAREDRKDGFRVHDKYNAIELSVSPATRAPEAGRGLPGSAVGPVRRVSLPAGPALVVAYQFESDPGPVTGKRLRMIAERYQLFRNGRLAILDLSAPLGADNADQWRRVSRSFRWN